MTRVGSLLIVAALVLLGWSGWSFYESRGSETHDLGKDRDLVLATGKRQVAALNSMDWNQSDAGLRQWLSSSTGPLHDQLERESAASRQKIVAARTTAVATVDDAAVLSLDVRSGTAQLIATVQVRLTPQAGQPTTQRKRYEAGLTRTPAGWKLKSLTAIPVSAS
ncbi:hypothetical protein ACGFNU_29395 [Spirillospora sp. NPDC048911]|uniref:hypothetical protein n=1 Tax=Spirillospora sp. NPDC048911 TaxID=3364527 RepID=UPI0037179C1A